MQPRTWTDMQLIEACKTSTSIRQVLVKLNLVPKGGSYKIVKNHISRLKIDTNHFLGQGWLKNLKHDFNNTKIPLEKILVENSTYNTFALKNRLLKEKLFIRKCYNCNLMEWMNKPIALELEHKNGINSDNRIINLTLLCPNCHAMTETYRGKNKGKSNI